jgi:mRNA interferase HicA
MPQLPMGRARELIAALERLGFVAHRQQGSHLVLKHSVTGKRAVVPVHGGDLPRPLLRRILKEAGVSDEQFRSRL